MQRVKLKHVPHTIRILFAIATIFDCCHGIAQDTVVSGVTPHIGSLAGETKLTITGLNFAENQFSYGVGNEGLGNIVNLQSKTHSYICRPHVDGSHVTQIQCYTPNGLPASQYTLEVYVDSERVPDANICGGDLYKPECVFTASETHTPLIQEIQPTSGPPETIKTLIGRIYTDRSGSEIAVSSNGRYTKILRVYDGPGSCDVRDPTDIFYGIELSGDYGHIMCKPTHKFVYYMNDSIILNEDFGRSRIDLPALKATADGIIYLYQSYAEIMSISPQIGSIVGGTMLTISGNNFDDTKAPIAVFVGGVPCDVGTWTETSIQCTVSAAPSATISYPGNRGIIFESWNVIKSFAELASVATLSRTDAGYQGISIQDSLQFSSDVFNNFVSRFQGYFTPSKDGKYQFFIKSRSVARLFFSTDPNDPSLKQEIASCSSSTSSYFSSSQQKSTEIQLEARKSYYIEVLHGATDGPPSQATVAARLFSTDLTSSMTGAAKQAIQRICVASVVNAEVQKISISGFTPSSSTDEVQTVDVTMTSDPLSTGRYRLGFYGVYSEILSADATAAAVESAISAVPTVYGVTVSMTTITNGNRYTVTFYAGLGNMPALDVRVEEGTATEYASVLVSEVTPGVPDLVNYQLIMDSIPSMLIATGASQDDITLAVTSMFQVGCPDAVDNPSGSSAYFEKFETTTSTGVLVQDEEPFCGTKSVKNPSYLYRNDPSGFTVLIQLYPWLCFAYRGVLRDLLRLKYERNGETFYEYHWYDFTGNSTEWKYVCFELSEIIPDVDLTYQLVEVNVYRELNTADDFFIDNVFIGSQPPDDIDGLNLRRKRAAMPGGQRIESVSVILNLDNTYDITLTPFECAFDLEFFELNTAQLTASTITSRTYSLAGAGLTVTKEQEASPPPSGTFDIRLDAQTKITVPIQSTEDHIRDILLQISVVGQSVTRTGTCANYCWQLEAKMTGGEQTVLSVESITDSLATVTLTEIQKGALWFDPIPGDLLRTIHDVPQAMVYINTIPAYCNISDCSFDYRLSATPTITSIVPNSVLSMPRPSLSKLHPHLTHAGINQSGPGGIPVTITGTMLASNPSVMICNIPCAVSSSSDTSITCTPGNGAAEPPCNVNVNVDSLGLAKHPLAGDVIFTYDLTVTTFSPLSGSTAGGALLSIAGQGFSSSTSVSVGVVDCPVISASAVLITCHVPESASTSDSSVAVTVTSGSRSSTASAQFNYLTSLTAVISAITPTTGSPFGGETITITGTGFGLAAYSNDALKIGTAIATILTYTDATITAQLPPLAARNHPVELAIDANGYADKRQNSIPDIECALKMIDVYPLKGSMYGGTDLTIVGEKFGTDIDKVEIKVGSFNCVTVNVADTEINCRLADTATIHEVTNAGVHPDIGQYYAWMPYTLTVKVGDKIRWSWQAPVANIVYRVYQTEDITSCTYDGTGFTSGDTGTKAGSYTFQFHAVGTYYYCSGFVDVEGAIAMHGVVHVEALISSVAPIQVKVNGFEPTYEVLPGVPDPPDTGICTSELSSITGCTDALPTVSDNSHFSYILESCLSPIVTEISRATPMTMADDVSGQVVGFTAINCQNEIEFSGHICNIISVTETTFKCSIAPSSEPPIGEWLWPTVRIKNRGNALVAVARDADKAILLVPHIDGLNPDTGSTAGGTRLEISGAGFLSNGGSVSIDINGLPCSIINLTYIKITCTTPASVEIAATIAVTVTVASGYTAQAQCKDVSGCLFTYAASSTPTVSSVTPNQVSSLSTSIVIAGSRFLPSGIMLSDYEVRFGSTDCVIANLNDILDSEITCTVDSLPAGTHPVSVYIHGLGNAVSTVTIQSLPVITSINPSSGSKHGGTMVKIMGYGFLVSSLSVEIDGVTVPVVSATVSEINIETPPGDGVSSIVVTSNIQPYPPQTYTYSDALTPTISNINPSSGSSGGLLTITGTGYSTILAENIIVIGGEACIIASATATSLTCNLGTRAAGEFAVLLKVFEKGYANKDQMFSYNLQMDNIAPNTGSFGGGQILSISGAGFDDSISVTICGNTCTRHPTFALTLTEMQCYSPSDAASVSSGTKLCDVEITVNRITIVEASAYTYESSLTSTVTSVTPSRGGTAGGTTVTITGTGFSSVLLENTVTIDGIVCAVSSATSTQIICVTGSIGRSVQSVVTVTIGSLGSAVVDGVADFFYIDVWSSTHTWAGAAPPVDGDFVIIPVGQTLLLDTNTAVLKLLLIKGELIFDDELDLELQAEIILITDGGLLQVGTESSPHQHKAIITLHGHFRSKEMPIYGTKVLALREGRLELHGKPLSKTWTRLATTANVGDTSIKLIEAVNWSVGDEVVIATTGGSRDQAQTETRMLTSVSGADLTFDEALMYEHLGVTETLSGNVVEFRAEVGLLTRNIVVRGSRDLNWDVEIDACPAGFNPGEFAVQTCFQGRFGDEIGSDQFGAHIIIHAPRRDENLAIGRFEYIEVTYAGQAFRLGRYPIHFHLNGDMSASYVRGCSIHYTFNRAINIHGSHNILVEQNVAYNVMGGAFFLEDGIEHGNTFDGNLGVFVRSSSSLLNEDIVPAFIWVTNPNNTVINNAAAGGTHFGFWYRMEDHPTGPSIDPDICPMNVELGIFRNNSAHSCGWFGLWIFPTYTPMLGSTCDSTTPSPAIFDQFFSYNNAKGAEFVNGGALQFTNFILVHNDLTGLEGKRLLKASDQFTSSGPMISDSLIAASTPTLTGSCVAAGITIPYIHGFQVSNVAFHNFDSTSCCSFKWTRIAGTCSDTCGGFMTKSQGLSFTNSPMVVCYEWKHEGIIKDLDGTMGGVTAESGQSILPTNNLLPNTCLAYALYGGTIPSSSCPSSVHLGRIAFNHVRPIASTFKNCIIVNSHGNDTVPYKKKHMTHAKGWMATLPLNDAYQLLFEDAEHLANFSMDVRVDLLEANDYIILEHRLLFEPDRFTLDGGSTFLSAPVSPLTASSPDSDWEFSSDRSMISYILTGDDGIVSPGYINRPVQMEAYRCYYINCTVPPDPSLAPPETRRSVDYVHWSKPLSWALTPAGWGGNYSNGSYGLPFDGDDVYIPKDMWMVADTVLPVMGTLLVHGVLELETGADKDYTLKATYIVIQGGRLIIGWEDNPFLGSAHIILTGSHSTPPYPVHSGPEIGAKAIACFGGCDLHGKDVAIKWTQLSQTATQGASSLSLIESVTWVVGDIIVITSTGYIAWQTETFMITDVSVDGLTLTVNGTFLHTHIGVSETINGQTYTMAAEVGLLTRNIKIYAEETPELESESYGVRMIVGLATDETGSNIYAGYARLSNVEFKHSGQNGYNDAYDPRYSVAFLNAGPVTPARPSYVKHCAFHSGYSPAIGVDSTDGIPILSNVIHHTVGPAIIVKCDDVRVEDNLIALVVWPGAYLDREESGNLVYQGAIDAPSVSGLRLVGNVVAGSERIAYHIPGTCDLTNIMMDNTAHSALIGVAILPSDKTDDCIKVSDFLVYKCLDFGVFIEAEASIEVNNMVLADNMLGIFLMVFGPSAIVHEIGDEHILIKDSLIIGTTATFDYISETYNSGDVNLALSLQSRTNYKGDFASKIGVSFSTYSSGSNTAPSKPFLGVMKYPTINGLTEIRNLTFAHFKTTLDASDCAIATNPNNDDGQHPLYSQTLTFFDVPTENRIYYHSPNVGKINSADCVDMDCDGLKKALLKDIDGSLLGSPGGVIPKSEFEWDGDQRRGLGDYRIPKVMLTDLAGNKLDVNTVAPHKGIIGNRDCTWHPTWNAYACPNMDYEMLIIESMDIDTETRRLSPVAILSDTGYVDLINGPQDHGWCSGYTCRKRLSTFMAIVQTNHCYDIYFTSTSPQELRLHLLNSVPAQAICLAVFYERPYRLDVYVNGDFVPHKNGYYTGDGKYQLREPTSPNEYMPLLTDSIGTNYVDQNSGQIHLTMKGPIPITILQTSQIVIAFDMPSLTVDEFFGEHIITNLALFFNIPTSKIRIVNVISESRRRRKRSAGTVTVYFEIGNEPSTSQNTTVSNYISPAQLNELTFQLTKAIQMNQLEAALNTTIIGISVSEPPPMPGSPEYATYVSQPVSRMSRPTQIIQVAQINLDFNANTVYLYEGHLFTIQPRIQALSPTGAQVPQLGTIAQPWQMTVNLTHISTSYSAAHLIGNTTVPFQDGWAQFAGLIISHPGHYSLDFNLTFPSDGNYTGLSTSVVVLAKPVAVRVVAVSTNAVMELPVNVVADLVDTLTSSTLDDIAWRGHTWSANLSLIRPWMYYGTMNGSKSVTFNPTTKQAAFQNLTFTSQGRYHVLINVQSNPPEYDLAVEAVVDIRTMAQLNQITEATKRMQMRFDADYSAIIGNDTMKEAFISLVSNYFRYKHPTLIFSNLALKPGSIIVLFDVSGSNAAIEQFLTSACDNVQNEMTFNFNGVDLKLAQSMEVDGQSYYGVNCGPVVAPPTGLSASIIAAICVSSVVILIIILAILIWRCYFYPRSKTVDEYSFAKHLGTDAAVNTVLFRDDTFTNLREKCVSSPLPPVDTFLRSATPRNVDFNLKTDRSHILK